MDIALPIVIGCVTILTAWRIGNFYYRKSNRTLEDHVLKLSTQISHLQQGHAAFREYEKTRGVKGIPPPLPHVFYGSVTINGSPAPIATRVEARGEGVRIDISGNPIVTTEVGKYWSTSPLGSKLVVQGDIADGASLTFYVNDVSTGQTAEWHSGNVTQLNLTVGSIRLYLRLFKWLAKWLRERKKRKGATPWGHKKREMKKEVMV